MKLLKLWRTFKEGFTNFYRNGWLTFATSSVIALSVFVVGMTVLLGMAGTTVLKSAQDKINISMYFKLEVEENRILDIKRELEKYREIRTVEYISRQQALDEFLAAEGENSTVREALEEIGDNPLPASLVITAYDPLQYELISSQIEQSPLMEEVSEVNFAKNRSRIENLAGNISIIRRTGTAVGFIFLFIAVLITFNTIRITLYSHRQEFEIMRLVGASNLYIRMPLVFEGIFYGVSAAVGAMALLAITVHSVSPMIRSALISYSTVNVNAVFYQNFWIIFGLLLLFSVTLGVVSSFIAIRRYLKI